MFSFVRGQTEDWNPENSFEDLKKNFNSYSYSFTSLSSNSFFETSSKERSSGSSKNSFKFLSKSSNSLSKTLPKKSNSISKTFQDENLIYHIDKIIDYQRLCIFSTLIKKILHLTHENDYSRFQKCYEIISTL